MERRIFGLLIVFTILFNKLTAQKDVAGTSETTTSAFDGGNSSSKKGQFITIQDAGGFGFRAFAAGPQDAKVGILLIHDFFGITPATREAVERLGAEGYQTIAVDLYKGRSATTNDSAALLMQCKDSAETAYILNAGIHFLNKPGRKLAAIGFSAGGVDAMKATLMAPELFCATIIVYGGGYDQIEPSKLDRLNNPVLAITGSLDQWPLQAGINFLAKEKDKSFEFFVYPLADHGYAQPFFNGGRNYDAEATSKTWMLINEFLLQNGAKKLKTSATILTKH